MANIDNVRNSVTGRCSDRRAWFRAKYSNITEHLTAIDWDYEFCYLSTNAMFVRLLELLLSLIEPYVSLSMTPHTAFPAIPPNSLKGLRENCSMAIILEHTIFWSALIRKFPSSAALQPNQLPL